MFLQCRHFDFVNFVPSKKHVIPLLNVRTSNAPSFGRTGLYRLRAWAGNPIFLLLMTSLISIWNFFLKYVYMRVASIASDNTEIDELSENLKILIQINNMLVKIGNDLQKLNSELCNMVSNLNNINYVLNKQIEQQNNTL